jgi:flagellar secretion chaperone FliS
MWQNARDVYLESRVLSADPLELVRMLYQAAISHVRDARRHLDAGDIMARCRAISDAGEILTELTAALDHERGGDISRRLASLYDYMQRKLVEANCRQDDAILGEVLGLMATLSEAWNGIPPATKEMEQAGSPWSPARASETASAFPAHAWSF